MITALAIGSRGDVEPQALLAGELTRRGFPTTVVAVNEYAELVRSHGAAFRGIGAGMAEMDAAADSWRGRLALLSSVAQADILDAWLRRRADAVATVLDGLVEPGSLVVTGLASRDAALALVEGRGCRMATLLHTAVLPTLQRASFVEGRRFTRWDGYNLAAARWWWTMTSGLSLATSGPLRRRLGLPRGSRRRLRELADVHPILLAASPTLVPPAPDWPATATMTGAIVAPDPDDYRPDALLADFLDSHERPVYLAAGSLNDAGGPQWLDRIVDVARLSGRRVVTLARRGQPTEVIDDLVCTVRSTPHAWLLPRMAGIVHHAGAGTTVAALRSGRPSTAVPLMFDQPYHAARAAALGVGPAPLSLRRASAPALAALIRDLTSGRYDARAADVERRVRAEDGLDRTVEKVIAIQR